jgi:anthranilate phosphoribosyltransferase
MIQAVLENQPGPAHNIVALNAGAAIYVSGIAKSLKSGVERAMQAIKSGAAKQKLEDLVAFTQKLKKA